MNLSFRDGEDCMWLATDQDGFVAAFFTAGIGPIPSEYLERAEAGLSKVEECVETFPVISDVLVLDPNVIAEVHWKLCSRGVFVFDWLDIERPRRLERKAYEAIAHPQTPLRLGNLDQEIIDLTEPLRINVRFATTRELRLEEVRENE